jgi:AraC-like DNA-binding protein
MTAVVEDFELPVGKWRDQQEQWDQLVSLTHGDMSVRLSRPADEHPYRGSIRRRWIGDLALVDCVCDPCSGTRSRSRVLAGEVDHVAVLFNLGGREMVSQAALSTEMRAGDVIVWDTRSPLRFDVRERLTKRSLVVPRAALAEVGVSGWSMSGRALDSSSAGVRLLLGYLELLSTTLPGMSAAAMTAARNATLELFVGAIRPDADGGGAAAPALRARMEAWINAHLADVSPARVAAAHGVSVRTVHRVFGADGETLGKYILSRRLARARQALAGRQDIPISTIARRFGFADASHFTRAFKAQYGTSPREYRAEVSPLAS